MLPFGNAKLLPKSKVFEEQVAARAKEASGHDRQKPQQAHHETSFTRVCLASTILSGPVVLIVARHGYMPNQVHSPPT
jgi:hypothetical protein